MVEKYIFQEGFLHEINPSSLNTIRVITIRHPYGAEAIHAFFRAGVKDAFVDNLQSGGILYPICMKSGIIGNGVSMNGCEYERHPSTNIMFNGQKIPQWVKILKMFEKAHEKAPKGLNLIGWNVCLSGDKIYFIEGNLGPLFCQMLEDENDWQKVMNMLKEWQNAST